MPELEQLILSHLARTTEQVHKNYHDFNFRAATKTLLNFAVNELSSFYFDIRKDVLYCDAYSSLRRRASRSALLQVFTYFTKMLSPILCFTAEEAWMAHFGAETSVHLQDLEKAPQLWRNPDLEKKWQEIQKIRKVVLSALEIERQEKNIGSSLEAAPDVYVADKTIYDLAASTDMAEVAITSQLTLINQAPPKEAFCLEEQPSIGVVYKKAHGKRCARSWKIGPEVGSNPAYPDLSPRDAEAVAEFEKTNPQQ